MTADWEKVRFTGALPVEPGGVRSGDRGTMQVLKHRDLPFTKAFERMVDQVKRWTGMKAPSAHAVPAPNPESGEIGVRE